ncbi:hypothetical protein ACEUEG_17890, partial [Aeromonas media]|uniref:hypothetical protein n=1 Tax=Aeromonas media TaxID=651 RepID=UPI0038CFC3D0
KRGGWSKKADFGVNTSEFWSNENFKREQAAYDEGAINLFAPSPSLSTSTLSLPTAHFAPASPRAT